MKMNLFVVLFVLAIFSTSTVMAAPVSAATIQIPAGSTNTQIQALIDSAHSGDTINFAPGTYSDISIIINKTLNFVGNGAIINGINKESADIFTVTKNETLDVATDASGSTFNGFEFNQLYNNQTLINKKVGSSGYAINLDRVSNIVVENVTSHNGKAAVNNAAACNVLVKNCTFTDDYGFCYGFNIMGGNNLTVTNSTITGCQDGVSMASSAANITIENNLLLNNIYSAFWGGGVSNITVQNNLINGFYEGLGIEKAASQTYVINNTFINGWGNNSAQKASGDAIYIKNSLAHGPLSVIDDIEIIGNTFKNIVGAAVGIDNQAGQGQFNASGTGNSIIGVNNSVTNVSKGYVVLYSQGQDLNFTMDSSTPKPQSVYANLSIKSAINPATIKTGDKTTYTITVKNTGTGNATNVKVSDILKNTFFSSITTYASLGSYANGNWDIGDLSTGNTASLVVTATALKAGTTSSQAIATANGNIKATSNIIKKTINKNVALKVVNSISTSKAKVGSFVYLRTNITNTGKDTSDSANYGISMQSGVKIISKNYQSYYNKNTKLWTVKVPAGKSITLISKVQVTSKGVKTVTFNNNGKKTTKTFTGY